MLVTMTAQISGLRDGKPWPGRGHSIDLPDAEALPLLERQVAIPAVDPDTGIEIAVRDVMPVETRDLPPVAAEDVVAAPLDHPVVRKRPARQ